MDLEPFLKRIVDRRDARILGGPRDGHRVAGLEILFHHAEADHLQIRRGRVAQVDRPRRIRVVVLPCFVLVAQCVGLDEDVVVALGQDVRQRQRHREVHLAIFLAGIERPRGRRHG